MEETTPEVDEAIEEEQKQSSPKSDIPYEYEENEKAKGHHRFLCLFHASKWPTEVYMALFTKIRFASNLKFSFSWTKEFKPIKTSVFFKK